MMQKSLLVSLFIVLCLAVSVSAYDINNLLHYYNFDKTNYTDNGLSLTDAKNGYNLETYHVTNTSGLIVNAGLFFEPYAIINGTIMEIGNEWSVTLYWNYDSVSGLQNIFELSKNTTYFQCRYDNVVNITCQSSEGTYISGVAIPSNESWHMIAMTYNSSGTDDFRLYIDGVLKSSVTAPLKSYNKVDMVRGLQKFDELGIWNTALSPSDITTLWNSGNGIQLIGESQTVTTDFTVSIYNINSKNVINNDGSQSVYVYPLYTGYPINAYYQLSSASVNNYFNVICDYSENTIVNDTFEYQNISVGGWTPTFYSTAVFDTRYGTSLFLNGSGSYVGDVRRAIIPSTTDAVNIKYLIRPKTQLGKTFSQATVRIQDGLGYDIMRYSYDYNTTTAQTCVYADIPSRTLLYCLDDDGNNFLENEIDVSINNQLYSMKTNIGLDAKYTAGLSPLKTFSNVGYVAVGIASSDYDAYFDGLTESIVPRYPILYQVNSSLNTSTGLNIWQYSLCDYSTIKCYKTRFFQQSTSTQAWNHYEDFDLCSSQTSQYVTQLDSSVASFWNGIFGTDATSTQSSRITTAIITMIVVFLVSLIALWVMLNDGKFAVAIATVVTSIMFVMFSITGYFPAWVVVLIIIFVSGILMIFARRIVTGG